MRDDGKKNVLGVLVDAVDYEGAVARILRHAREGRPMSVTALAVHGVMTGVTDREHRYRLNHLDLVTPDGQPVRWALNWLHKSGLRDRVYGPDLTIRLLSAAADQGLPVYFLGTTEDVLDALREKLSQRFPGLQIAGSRPSMFRQISAEEKTEIVEEIRASGAKLTFVGLGCPRQEVFVYEFAEDLGMPAIAVGAAFNYHAGLLKEPPAWVQKWGLQWAYRLVQDPKRLWHRYLVLNSAYVARLALQLLRVHKPDPRAADVPRGELRYG